MNMGRKKNEPKKHSTKKWDIQIPQSNYFEYLELVSENRIIWGGNYFTEYLPPNSGWIFWNKNVPKGVSFSDGELAWTSFDRVLRKLDLTYSGFQGMEENGKQHPTQKPVALYKWLLQNYAKPNDKILDTHGGSMSIAIACWDLGFDLDIIELDKDYYDKAVERFERHINQKQLF
jgi:site-specific DNA-methyltransferase (adenine-specific)